MVEEKFASLFGGDGRTFASAGRINLIGEHTDYNGGYVFPGAISCGITVTMRPNGGDTVRVWSVDFDGMSEFGLAEEEPPPVWMAAILSGISASVIVPVVPSFALIASAIAVSLSVRAILDHPQFCVNEAVDVVIRNFSRNLYGHS